MVASVTGKATSISALELAPSELGETFGAMRLCAAQAQREMQLSLSRLGQLTPVQAYRVGASLEVFDGLKRLRAARELSWLGLRVEVHALDGAGAKVRLLCCNASSSLAELEEAWLVRSLYREEGLSQPQIAMLVARHKSWVCRRLALAESLSEELTASVRLGLVGATAAAELALSADTGRRGGRVSTMLIRGVAAGHLVDTQSIRMEAGDASYGKEVG